MQGPGVLTAHAEEENFLDLIPGDASPDMAAIAFGLYAHGYSLGVRGGEEAAFARLRHIIGAGENFCKSSMPEVPGMATLVETM